jgi:high-affinity iron transporter
MLSTGLIVFRETLEAALFIGIVAASCRGLAGRARWLSAGVLAGIVGSVMLAAAMGEVSAWADGLGQEMVNVVILGCALAMLGYHSIWVSTHGREMAQAARSLGQGALQGQRTLWALTVAVALSVLREGAETVLFVAGFMSGQTEGVGSMLLGAATGLLAGALLGVAIYAGMARIKTQHIFAVTQLFMLMLTGSLASQLAKNLHQADVLSWGSQALWDSSWLLSDNAALAVLLHALMGYEARPSALQLVFYMATIILIATATRWVSKSTTRSHDLPNSSGQTLPV